MNRFSLYRIDWSLLLPAVLLVLLSLATLFSIDFTFFKQQLIFFILATVSYFIFLNIDYKFFGYYVKYIYALCILGLIIILAFGTVVNGSKSWLVLFGIHLQVEELIKPFFIIIIAYFLSHAKSSKLTKYILSGVIVLPIIFLILRQPDTGTALMYISTFFGMLLLAGFPVFFYLITLFLAVIPAPIIFELLKPYQKERLLTLFNPTSDPFGSSYNAIQALISIGSGGFFGKGLGEGTQSILRFLPERHTDFIFASISEGLGFVGGFFVICLLCFLLYRIYKISRRVGDPYPYLIVVGSFFIILVQMVVNIGMNMGLMPIIGITLPFVSYGGSSLITCFIILGIVSSIGYEYRGRQTLEIT